MLTRSKFIPGYRWKDANCPIDRITFSKHHSGLYKKASKLECNVDIRIMLFSSNNLKLSVDFQNVIYVMLNKSTHLIDLKQSEQDQQQC